MHPVELPVTNTHKAPLKPHRPTSSMPHTLTPLAHTYTYTHFDVQNKRKIRAVNKINNIL